MSLELAVRHALQNPIESRGRTNISRFGVILTDGYRTFKGWNSYKSHPLQAKYAKATGCEEKIHIHAEIAAITKAFSGVYSSSNLFGKFKPLKKYEMYIARVFADGTPACAAPCEGCLAAITEFGIKYVEWTE